MSLTPPIDPGLFGAEEPSEAFDPEVDAPQVLLRAVTTPPAPPWDQARAAEMEARLQAPLPADVVTWRLRRLEPWRPGQAGRYLAAYVRRTEIGEGLSTTETFDGAGYTFDFLPPGKREAMVRRVALVAAGAGVATLVTALALVAAIQARGEAATQLASIELTLDRRQAQAASQAELARRDQILVNAGLEAQRPYRALADLAWIGQSRVQTVTLEAALWEPGLTAVEVRGEGEPFQATDRLLRRAPKPVRPGVNLWGVSELGVTPQAAP